MPSIEDLERFKESFRGVGGESASTDDDFPLPEAVMDEDLANLLGGDASAGFGGGEDAGGDAGGGFDFNDFLNSIPDSPAELGGDGPDAFNAEDAPSASPPPGEEDFGMPAGLLDGLGDEAEADAAGGGDAGEAGFGDFDLGDLGDLGTAAPAAGGGDDFSIPDFGDEASGAVPDAAEAGGLEDLGEADAGDAGAAEASPFDFDLPSGFGGGGDEEALSLFSEEPAPKPEEPKDSGSAEDDPFAMPDFDLGDSPAAEAAPGTEAGGGDFDLGSGFGAADGLGGLDDFSADGFGGAGGFGAADAPLDAFDTFSLDDNLAAGFGGGEEKAEGGKQEEGFANLEDFSLEGIDDAFKAPAQGAGMAALKAAKAPKKARPAKSRGGEVEEINLSDEDFASLQATLDSYPLNLRVACEELIAEHAVPPDDMAELVRKLVAGNPARDTAALASRLLGKSVVIPRGFEKSSGAALEAERDTFLYAFVHNILPVLRVFLFAATVTACLVYLFVQYVYTPMHANRLYAMGMERVLAGDYARGNDRFEEAGKVWRMKDWYYRYAEAFADKRQYLFAEEKYDQLLAWWPHDEKGALDYAALETYVLLNYEKADKILRHQILDFRPGDLPGLLAQGDNNLAWGDVDPSRYEEARAAYADLIKKEGKLDVYLERMLLYLMRTDRLGEVLPLEDHFLKAKKPQISAEALSELGGYLFDKKTLPAPGVPDPHVAEIDHIKDVLLMARKISPAYPETYYHLARYFERLESSKEELEAGRRAKQAFEAWDKLPLLKAQTGYAVRPTRPLRWTKYRIDNQRRVAAQETRNREYLKAEEDLRAGIALYEDALNKKMLPKTPDFGRLYADLGDLEYFKAGRLAEAVEEYHKAEEQGWEPPEMRYRLGYAAYAGGDWKLAMDELFAASRELPLNRRLLFALGNSFYRRGDLYAAQGYYQRLLDGLEKDKTRFMFLDPEVADQQADLADRLLRARNNLGATLAKLSERSGNAALRARATALYAESSQAWDLLAQEAKRNPRSGPVNLAFLNTRGSLYPKGGYEPQIYAEIDKDNADPSAWEKLLAED